MSHSLSPPASRNASSESEIPEEGHHREGSKQEVANYDDMELPLIHPDDAPHDMPDELRRALEHRLWNDHVWRSNLYKTQARHVTCRTVELREPCLGWRRRKSRRNQLATDITHDTQIPSSPPRTPAPHAVRSITHQPFFSTEDTALSTFTRLPYEIRMIIYRLLLILDDNAEEAIGYDICPTTFRLVYATHHSVVSAVSPTRIKRIELRHYPFRRHGLFPAIIETCRLIYEEAMPVLYGENTFRISTCCCTQSTALPVMNSWPLPRRARELINRVDLGDDGGPWKSYSPTEKLDIFGNRNLRKVKLRLGLGRITDVGSFIDAHGPRLFAVGELVINVPWSRHFKPGLLERGKADGLGEEETINRFLKRPIEEYNDRHWQRRLVWKDPGEDVHEFWAATILRVK